MIKRIMIKNINNRKNYTSCSKTDLHAILNVIHHEILIGAKISIVIKSNPTVINFTF